VFSMIGRIPLFVAGGASALALLVGVLVPTNHKAKAYLAKLVGGEQQRQQQASTGAKPYRSAELEGLRPQGPVPPTQFGINVAQLRYYTGERAFANLAIGSTWLPPASERVRGERKKKRNRAEQA